MNLGPLKFSCVPDFHNHLSRRIWNILIIKVFKVTIIITTLNRKKRPDRIIKFGYYCLVLRHCFWTHMWSLDQCFKNRRTKLLFTTVFLRYSRKLNSWEIRAFNNLRLHKQKAVVIAVSPYFLVCRQSKAQISRSQIRRPWVSHKLLQCCYKCLTYNLVLFCRWWNNCLRA